ncbi:MAG: FAD:protein FMN transferase [Clostridia bacterium]|nr:FAD:protein FMN transferase [Clostridia bacterium]
MKKLICICLIFCLLLTLASCSATETSTQSFFLMDTVITVTLYTSTKVAEPIFMQCRAILEELDALWSRTKGESDVCRFNASSDGISDADARTFHLISTALEVTTKTDGAFDITVAPLVTLWQSCAEEDRLPNEAELDACLQIVGAQNLTLTDGGICKSESRVQMNLGGIGKGAAISILINYLNTCAITGGLVSFGSNVAVFGSKPDGSSFRIALRDPTQDSGIAGTLLLGDGEVLSVSGDYERYHTIGGERYHHILDPATGYPSQSGLTSVAVICRDGALADALSTALFVMGIDAAMEFYASGVFDFEAIFIASDGTVTATRDGLLQN